MKNEIKIVNEKFIIYCNGSHAIRTITNLLFCKSVCHYTEMYFDDKTPIKAPIGINELELLLPKDLFYKFHKRYIINLAIMLDAIIIEGKLNYHGHVLPISRNKTKEFMEKAEAFHTSNRQD